MLTKVEKQVLGQVQAALPLCQRPFAAVGRRVGCTLGEVIDAVNDLKAGGYIRHKAGLPDSEGRKLKSE